MVLSQTSHCALVILMTLARHYETNGVLLKDIADEHNIPEAILKPIVQRLCAVEIIHCEVGVAVDVDFLFLKRDPNEICAYDIVVQFDEEVFSGRFFNPETGALLPKSILSIDINFERKQMLSYMRKRLKKISIAFWSEQAYRHLGSSQW